MKYLTILIIVLITISVVFDRKVKKKGKRNEWPSSNTFKAIKNLANYGTNKIKGAVVSGAKKLKEASSTAAEAAENIIKINSYTWKSKNVPKPKFIFKKENRLKDFSADVAKYYTNIAGYGYCSFENMILNKCCQNLFTSDYVFVTAEKIDKDNYNIGIIRSDKFKRVIVVLPGTRKYDQLLSEFVGSNLVSYEGSNTIKVLSYFNQVYEQMKNKIFPHIQKQYKSYPDYQFVFTGHSLGGAMATLFSLGVVRNKIITPSRDSPVLITFGAPRPGNDVFANEVMNNVPIVFRVVRQGDPVAVVPPCLSDAKMSQCLSVLPDHKFVPKTKKPEKNKNDNSANLPSSNYYSQIGGLKLFKEEFTDYNDCGNKQGEFHVDDPCHSRRTTNVDWHTIYARIQIAVTCDRRRKRRFKK